MLDFAVEVAYKAGSFLRDNLNSKFSVELKGRINPVTSIDRGLRR